NGAFKIALQNRKCLVQRRAFVEGCRGAISQSHGAIKDAADCRENNGRNGQGEDDLDESESAFHCVLVVVCVCGGGLSTSVAICTEYSRPCAVYLTSTESCRIVVAFGSCVHGSLRMVQLKSRVP